MNDPILLKMKDLYAVGKTKEQRELEWKDKITEPKLIAEYKHQSLLERIKGFVKKFL